MSTCATLINIPGPAGDDGAAGADGTNGKNAYSVLTDSFAMPAVGGTGVAEVEDTSWMIPTSNIGTDDAVGGQVIIVEFLGSFLISEIVDATHAVLYNLGYPMRAAPGTVAPSGSKVSVGGQRGP